MPKVLTREMPNEGLEDYPWDLGSQKRFHLDSDEIAELEEGKVVWRGQTAFTLEDSE